METPDPLRGPLFASGGCPRCGSSSAAPFDARGVCLRCAGVRVLSLESDGAPLADPSLVPSRDETRPDLPDRIGAYEIIEELGRGGMARVFAARQIGLGRIVAIKAIAVGRSAADLELRFLREAQTVARLRHPHIVAVHDSGREHGYVYFSMDYIDGGDLARRLRTEPFAPRAAAELLRQVAGALAYTHGEGVLHRDLKPSNILLDGNDPRVADFGLAAQLEAGGDLTAATGLLGTPHYVAPEALRRGSAALSVQSDLYALGVILFEMLTGRTPFAGASPAELAAIVGVAEPPSPRLLAPAVPRDLATICLKCLEREPARRYADASALADDLARFLAGRPIVARPISGPGRFLRWCRRRPALATVWVLLSALAIGSTIAAGWINRERSRAQQALALAEQAEDHARERLRDARLAEARALRRTLVPGRRTQALAALAEAARIRPGADLRDEALAVLLRPDIQLRESFDLATGLPGEINFDPAGKLVTFEPLNDTGLAREPARVSRWGDPKPFARIEVSGVVPIGRLRFSRDGVLVMARYRDATLRVWRVGEAQPFLTLAHRPWPETKIATEAYNDDYDFSPDGKRLALGLPGGGVSLHRVSDGTELARWSAPAVVNTLRFSPDGGRIAAAEFSAARDRPTVFVLAAADASLQQALVPGDEPSSLAWRADGRELAVALRQNLVMVYDVRDGRLLQKFTTTARNPSDLVYLGRETLLAVRGTGSSMHLVNAMLGHDELVLDGVGPSFVAPSPDHTSFEVANLTGRATRWEVLPPVGFRLNPPPRPSGYDRITDSGAFDFSPDGRWVVTSGVRFTLLRDVASGRLEGEIDEGVSDVANMSTAIFAADGHALVRCSVASGLRRVPLAWSESHGFVAGPSEALDPETGFVITDFTPDRRRLALIDYETGDVKIIALGPTGATTLNRWRTRGVYGGAFSPDGEQILVNCAGVGPDGAKQRLQVHRVRDGAVVAELAAPVSCDVVWSADGHTALTSNGQTESVLWDTATWRRRATLVGALGGNITTFALSPNGAYAVIVHDQSVHLVSTKDGSRLATFDVPESPGLAVAIRFVPGRGEFAILWRDSRIDYFEPEALRRELHQLGLTW